MPDFAGGMIRTRDPAQLLITAEPALFADWNNLRWNDRAGRPGQLIVRGDRLARRRFGRGDEVDSGGLPVPGSLVARRMMSALREDGLREFPASSMEVIRAAESRSR